MESANLDLSPDPLLPVRPRFMDELVYIDADNEIIIDGSDRLGVLHGAAIHHLLPKVIPLLDGHNTVAEIESSIIGVPTAHVRETIRKLFDLGLIEDASSDDLLTQHASPETVAFCRRFLKATRWNNSGYVAAKTLEAAQVGILDSLGDNWPSALLHSVLTRTGVGRIKRLNRNLLNKQLPFAESNTNQALLVSLSMNGEDPALLAEIDDRCRRLQIRWLRVVHDLAANYADIGPLFCDECACYRCFAEFHGRPSSTLLNGTLEMNSSAALWIGMAAAEITYLISRIGPLITGRGLRRYDLRLWKSKDLHYCSVPGCSCSLPLRRGSQVFDSAAVFESYVGLRSSDVIDPSSYRQATTLGLSLSRQSKRYDTCPQFTLNPALLTVNDGIWDALNLEVKEPLGLFAADRLATILKMTAGFRSESEIGSVRRWTASAGNLGSVELYVAANRVDGLKRGLYYYQSRNHSLASIERRGGTTDIDSLMEFTLCHLTGEAPDALVLLTGAFHRLARKYGSFAYRLMHFDAGLAIAQMLLLARGLRLWSIAVPVRMDDRIDRELGLDTFNEQPTALVSISRTVCPMREARGGQLGQPLGNRLATGAQDYHELEISDVLRRVYHESRAIDTGVALGCPPRVMPAPIEQSNDTLRHFLPSPSTWSSKPLQQILEARTTVRRYSDNSVSLSQLSAILHYASDSGGYGGLAVESEPSALHFYVIAGRVEGLRIGVYIYNGMDRSLDAFRALSVPNAAKQLYVQAEFADAPVQIWIAGDISAACARHGANGYRQLLVIAGTAVQRLWLAALGVGLVGAPIAGLVSGRARRELGLDAFARAPLIAFALGAPVPALPGTL